MKFFALALLLSSLSSVGYGKVMVIVAKDSKVANLSDKDVSDIFLGNTKTFPNGDTAAPCAHKSKPLANEFYKGYSSLSATKAKLKWTKLVFTGRAKKPKTVASQAEAVEFVNGTAGGICFVDSPAADAKVVSQK